MVIGVKQIPCERCKQLETENAKLKQGIIDDKDITTLLVPRDLYEKLEAENERLKVALRKHGVHTLECEYYKKGNVLKETCDCGLEQALKGGQEQ